MHIGADKLWAEAGIDSRSSTDFKLRLEINPNTPDFTPVDFAVFSNRNSNRALAGFHATIRLLESQQQLGILPPRVPRILVGHLADGATEVATMTSTTLTDGNAIG
jgi:hypothetical protein